MYVTSECCASNDAPACDDCDATGACDDDAAAANDDTAPPCTGFAAREGDTRRAAADDCDCDCDCAAAPTPPCDCADDVTPPGATGDARPGAAEASGERGGELLHAHES
jgi:hypothetical protein